MNDERNYLTTREAAEYLGLSARTLRRYRVTGEGPVFHRFGAGVRYRREDLDDWARDRRRVSTVDDGSVLSERHAPGSQAPASGPRRAGAGRARAKVPGSGEPVCPDRRPGRPASEPGGQADTGGPEAGAVR